MAICPGVIKTDNNSCCIKTSNNRVVIKSGYDSSRNYGIPKVMLQWSDDGGKTWGNEYWKSAGKIGEYKTRVTFNRLGMSRDRVFRVVVSDPVRWVIMGARIDAEAEK